MISLDTETCLIWDAEKRLGTPGVKAPPLVCTSSTYPGAELLHHPDAAEFALHLLRNHAFTGHHIAYDMAVLGAHEPMLLPEIFAAYERDQITCTIARQKLIDNSRGLLNGWLRIDGKNERINYDLSMTSQRLLGTPVQKEDTWRLRYGELRDVPLSWWPRDAKEYAILDGRVPAALYDVQERERDVLADQYRTSRASFLGTLIGAWGFHCDPRAVRALADAAKEERDRLMVALVREGLVRAPRPLKSGPNKGKYTEATRNEKATKERLFNAYARRGERPPLSPKTAEIERATGEAWVLPSATSPGADPRFAAAWEEAAGRVLKPDQVSIDSDACRDSLDPVLIAYGRYSQLEKRLNTDVPMLEAGVTVPIQVRYDELKANGRMGTSNPNSQNWPREQGKDSPLAFAARALGIPFEEAKTRHLAGDKAVKVGPSVRECVIPRPGMLFASADFAQIELHTLAQVCLKMLGRSRLAEALNAGMDPHLALAAQVMGISYEEAKTRLKAKDDTVKYQRQASKPPNFGLPGGLGIKRLQELAKNDYGIIFTDDEAKKFKADWHATWPEMRPYLDKINGFVEAGGTIRQLFSDRVRGKMGYCDCANTFFSGLAADLAKDAGWHVLRSCYVDTRSILWGSRVVMFTHDEFVLESPDYKAAECAEELARIMVEIGKLWLPDVTPKAEPCLMARWSKEAETKRDENGRLTPWRPAWDIAA